MPPHCTAHAHRWIVSSAHGGCHNERSHTINAVSPQRWKLYWTWCIQSNVYIKLYASECHQRWFSRGSDTSPRPCVNLRSVGVLCQVLEAHKIRWEEEYEKMKLGNSDLQSFYLTRALQVTFRNAVAVSTLKQAYPWPLIVPVRNHFATCPTRTNLLVRAAILNQGHSKIDATTVTSDMCWSHSPPIVLTHVPKPKHTWPNGIWTIGQECYLCAVFR